MNYIDSVEEAFKNVYGFWDLLKDVLLYFSDRNTDWEGLMEFFSFIRWGHTPIEEAERENHVDVVEFLQTVL